MDTPLAQYSFRRSVLEQERVYSVYADRITIEGGGLPSHVYPLTEVRRVHLKYEHTKQREYYVCLIETKRGRISLRHVHWSGFNDFEDRRATYAPFVRALLAALAPHPHVQYRAGSLANYIAAIVGVPVMTTLLIVCAVRERTTGAILSGFMLALCLLMIRPSRPRRLDPMAPPADLLPTSR